MRWLGCTIILGNFSCPNPIWVPTTPSHYVLLCPHLLFICSARDTTVCIGNSQLHCFLMSSVLINNIRHYLPPSTRSTASDLWTANSADCLEAYCWFSSRSDNIERRSLTALPASLLANGGKHIAFGHEGLSNVSWESWKIQLRCHATSVIARTEHVIVECILKTKLYFRLPRISWPSTPTLARMVVVLQVGSAPTKCVLFAYCGRYLHKLVF